MTRPSYKKLYLQEKRRRELYETWEPTLRGKYDRFATSTAGLAADMEAAIVSTPCDFEKPTGVMKGLSGWVTTWVEEL